jgi:DNA-binding protein YbaB
MSDLSNILDDVYRTMGQVIREAGQARDRLNDPELEAAGSALDGKISVKLSADGRVRELLLADEVMKLSAAELSREIVTAINQAWAASRSEDAAAVAAAAVDPAALVERMKALQQESARSMMQITDALADTMRKIDRRLS